MQIIKNIKFQFFKQKNFIPKGFIKKQVFINPKMQQEIENLKQKISELENQNLNLTQKLIKYEPQISQQDIIQQQLKQKKEEEKNQQKKGKLSKLFEQCVKKRYAFKLAYIGIQYQGIEYQKDNTNTVEYHLFQAFKKTCLVEDINNINTVNYSRSGRTDAGVSALGNVIAFDVRTSIKKDGPENQKNNIDYVKMLNGVLPPDIRILSATEVNPDFNARFDCNYRVYKYFFHRNGMDIENLKQGAQHLLGEHDFRNFCKIDVLATTNYIRNILDVNVELIQENRQDNNMDMFCITIKGTAFLWHMIRCIMSVLFSVGEGKEQSSIVQDLLDIQKYPKRPGYAIASDLPLILYDCVYENIKFKYDKVNTARIYDHYREIVKKRMIEQQLYQTSMGFMLQQKSSYFNQEGQQESEDFNMKEYIDEYLTNQQKNKKYHTFDKMPKCDTPEEQISKLKGKKLEYYNQKLQKQQENQNQNQDQN